ncbi:TLDc domain-containing protein, partial [Syncephalis pseudoplumigaleata]
RTDAHHEVETAHAHSLCVRTHHSFLWRLENDGRKLVVFPWSGKNDYSIMTESGYLAIGADNGKFGLWIDSNFDKGSSMPCATFDNPTLSAHETFTCVHLEIWALQ